VLNYAEEVQDIKEIRVRESTSMAEGVARI
jgi:hypothetical protein